MAIDNPRILVIGAGVNGSIGAVGLHDAGFDVTVLARGQRYADLQADGIIIEDQLRHTRSVTRLPLIDHLDPADCYDYVLVVVRKSQVSALLPVLAQNVSPNIVFMVNNLSGPVEYMQALGKERVMLGFVFGGGRREDKVIRAIIAKGRWLRFLATPFGEIDGTISPRLTRLVAIFNRAGLHAEPSRQIIDWQATHAVGIPCLARPLMKYNLDTAALAKSKTDVGLMVDGLRESLDVLQTVGYHIVPRNQAIIRFIPRFLLVAGLRMMLPTRFIEMGGVWHVSQAPDEMDELAAELAVLVEKSGLPVPALRKLLAMNSPAAPHPVESGA